jgi:hypothetical protein
MTRPTLFLLIPALLGMAGSAFAQQAQPGAAEAKLREGLRNTMLQLRTMQGERDQLIVDKTALETEKKELGDKLEALTKQTAANQAAAQQSIAQLEGKVGVREAEAAQLTASLEKWQASQKQAAALAAKKEGERATAAARIIELDRQVADQQRKNAAMFKVGMEVLHRYEKFVLGDAIVAREPFTGIARVKFQTLVQDFQDQITDQRIKPEEPPAAPKSSESKPPAKTAPSATPAPAKTKPVQSSKPQPVAAPAPAVVRNAEQSAKS